MTRVEAPARLLIAALVPTAKILPSRTASALATIELRSSVTIFPFNKTSLPAQAVTS
jgi:hypothetical protein